MTDGLRWLVAVAAEREIASVLQALCPGTRVPEPWDPVDAGVCEVVRTGVGKASAAGATARCFDPETHAGVLSIGIAGALPGSWLEPGEIVLADPSFFADEGVLTPKGLTGLGEMGFGADAPPAHPDGATRARLMPLVDAVGPIATVSVCSGTDAWAGAVAGAGGGGGAIAEAMEGAACALAARRIDPRARFAELRVISNTTGDRSRQRWELETALARLGVLARGALDALGAR